MITVLIPCAGKGERFGEGLPKQYLDLKGVPLFIRTLLSFERHPACKFIVLSVDERFKALVEERVREYGIGKVWKVVSGGKTRQESVLEALKAAPVETELFLVHDAVRPFLTEDLISRLIEEAHQHEAAIPVIPVRDALIRGEEGFLCAPLSREGLFLVQTPQAIRATILRECLLRAQKEGLNFPDESSLLHHYGYRVKLVYGSIFNLKITYKEDFLLAERLISK